MKQLTLKQFMLLEAIQHEYPFGKFLERSRELTGLVKRGLVETDYDYTWQDNRYFTVKMSAAGDDYMHEGDYPDAYWERLAETLQSEDDW